jgi:hypothetical protein
MGWASKKNGELLRLMSEQFDVFITVDGNLRYQQDISKDDVACVVLRAYNNRLATLKPLMPKVTEVLKTIKRGDVIVVE